MAAVAVEADSPIAVHDSSGPEGDEDEDDGHAADEAPLPTRDLRPKRSRVVMSPSDSSPPSGQQKKKKKSDTVSPAVSDSAELWAAVSSLNGLPSTPAGWAVYRSIPSVFVLYTVDTGCLSVGLTISPYTVQVTQVAELSPWDPSVPEHPPPKQVLKFLYAALEAIAHRHFGELSRPYPARLEVVVTQTKKPLLSSKYSAVSVLICCLTSVSDLRSYPGFGRFRWIEGL